MNILFIGKPGSGKGTLSQRLSDAGFTQLSTGDLLREEIKSGSEQGKGIQKLIDQGKFASDQTIFEVVAHWIDQQKQDVNIILDGFPRNMAQMNALLASDPPLVKIDGVVHFECSDEVISKRLAGRLIHAPSGRIYHQDTLKPKVAGYDDITGEPLTKRPDDKPDIIEDRLALYQKVTAPVLTRAIEANIPSLTLDADMMIEAQKNEILDFCGELVTLIPKSHKKYSPS